MRTLREVLTEPSLGRSALPAAITVILTAAPDTASAEMSEQTAYVFNTLSFLVHGFLVLWMAAGFAMLEAGLVRTKSVTTILLKNIALFSISGIAFYVVGYNLRHSHIWLDFGAFERVFVSPAMHQIHHSVDTRHLNRNMGEIFAIWDWLFGTIYIPHEKEDLVFGVGRGVPQEHPSLLTAYLVPIRNAGGIMASWFRPRPAQRPPPRSRRRRKRKGRRRR